MPKQVSKEKRCIILRMILKFGYYCEGSKRSRIVRLVSSLMNVSERQIWRYIKRYHCTKSILSKPEIYGGNCGRARVTVTDIHIIVHLLKTYHVPLNPKQLSKLLPVFGGSNVHPTTIRYWLVKCGVTRKRCWFWARESKLFQVKAFFYHLYVHNYHMEQFVWMDESHVNNKSITTKYGYTPKGIRPVFRKHFIRGTKYSVILAADVHGIVNYGIVNGCTNAHIFFKFIIRFLARYCNPFPGPRSITIVDNCSIHKYLPLKLIYRFYGTKMLYLSPYSPWLMPVEVLFNCMKMKLQAYHDYYLRHPITCLSIILEQMRDFDVMGFALQSGYGHFCQY